MKNLILNDYFRFFFGVILCGAAMTVIAIACYPFMPHGDSKTTDADYTITRHHEHIELKTTDGKTVYSGTFNPDSNSIEQAIINDNL